MYNESIISCQLKKRILEDNIRSREDRKERSLVICLDEDGKWIPAKEESSAGGEHVVGAYGSCKTGRIQGVYHNHPIVKRTLDDSRNVFPEEMITEEIMKVLAKTKRKDVLRAIGLSQIDVAGNIIDKFTGKTKGTECVGSDARPNIVECWTVYKNIDSDTYRKALKDLTHLRNVPPKNGSRNFLR